MYTSYPHVCLPKEPGLCRRRDANINKAYFHFHTFDAVRISLLTNPELYTRQLFDLWFFADMGLPGPRRYPDGPHVVRDPPAESLLRSHGDDPAGGAVHHPQLLVVRLWGFASAR